MMPGKKYEPEFKQKIVKEALETGNCSIVGRKHSISSSIVARWVREYKRNNESAGIDKNQLINYDTLDIKNIEKENESLKKLLEEKDLEIAILRDLLKNPPTLEDKIEIAFKWINAGYKATLVLRILRVSRSTYYYKKEAKINKGGRPYLGYSFNKEGKRICDEQIKEWLCELIEGEGEFYGYTKLTFCLQRKYNLYINKKKVYRLCKELDLLRPQRQKKIKHPRKIARNRVITAPNQLWEIDVKYGYISGEDRFFYIAPIIDVYDLITSSIQANLDNPYGRSKKAGEDLVFNFGKENDNKTLVYRLPNLFGKWCRPNYNSVVATFCYNIANDLPIKINDPNVVLTLAYIDDVVEEFINALEGRENRNGEFCEVSKTYNVSLGKIAELIYSFKKTREEHTIPNMSDEFTKKLYNTYLSYLPKDKFSYELKMNVDNRGSFTEFIKTLNRGQVSVNISKPGITKGNHWHHTKNEKFLVVSGKGVIRFRKIDSDEIIEYYVSGDKLEVVDIPPGYTHNIENLGDTDLVTIMWANEPFDPEKPDTYYLEV